MSSRSKPHNSDRRTGGILAMNPTEAILSSPVYSEGSVPASLSAYGPARSTIQGSPLGSEELQKTHAFWRACNYLMLGMIYLQENPLLKVPLQAEQCKKPPSWPLGIKPRSGISVHSLHENDQDTWSGHDLSRRAWTWSPRCSRTYLSGRNLFGNLSGQE